jgi:hypothetical protein
MWPETELRLQQNVLLCDLIILCTSHKPQLCQTLSSHWLRLAHKNYASGSLNNVECCLVTGSPGSKFSRSLKIFMPISMPM